MVALVTLLALTGCAGGDDESGSDGTDRPAASPATSSATGTPSGPATGSPTVSPTASGAAEVVDPGPFARTPGGAVYLFTSPTGKLACGFDADGASGFLAGCHARDVVGNLPACDDPDAHGPWAAIHQDRTAATGCQHEGVFFGEETAVLEYGQALEVGDIRCESGRDGVTCQLPDGTGFAASRAEFTAS